ncbi:DUF5615 family PIN-like protein [Dyadobacter sp. CY356]|uniref:DUF5615 family PIN-like protein n=1 Tax=Dyadobacter sp. CY356 TaxID=2906442 RepID=UPI001F463D33|nr:DUF5615 family PIN-like protein [Dyadobacter sp. CY356]MCF0058614.1 DUF5615 family PIN-like protein [Dyadobacter sp. CY356]
MKLLFDENISYRVIKKLQNVFPLSIHVSDTTLKKPAKDRVIWEYAKTNDFTLVTFDEDFQDLLNVYGFPPKIILLRMGNSSTEFISDLLKRKQNDIFEFHKSGIFGLLEIF